MSPDETLLAVLKARDAIRPMNYWKTHCPNCGAHITQEHRRNDCPPQEKTDDKD